MAISKAIKKYGKENFTIELLEECSSLEELLPREKFWIEKINSLYPNGYNLKTESKTKGYLSEETKRRISKGNKGKVRTREALYNLSISHLGNKHSEKTKRKLSEHFKGIRPCKLAQENSLKATIKSYTVLSPEGNITEISNMRQFCRDNNLSPSKMCLLVQGKRNHHKGWKCIDKTISI